MTIQLKFKVNKNCKSNMLHAYESILMYKTVLCILPEITVQAVF